MKLRNSIIISLFALAFSFCSLNVSAQMQNPVSWKFEAKKKATGVYVITATATVDKP